MRKLHQNPLLKATTAGIQKKHIKTKIQHPSQGSSLALEPNLSRKIFSALFQALLIARLRCRSSPEPHVVNLSLNPRSAKAPYPTLQSSVGSSKRLLKSSPESCLASAPITCYCMLLQCLLADFPQILPCRSCPKLCLADPSLNPPESQIIPKSSHLQLGFPLLGLQKGGFLPAKTLNLTPNPRPLNLSKTLQL